MWRRRIFSITLRDLHANDSTECDERLALRSFLPWSFSWAFWFIKPANVANFATARSAIFLSQRKQPPTAIKRDIRPKHSSISRSNYLSWFSWALIELLKVFLSMQKIVLEMRSKVCLVLQNAFFFVSFLLKLELANQPAKLWVCVSVWGEN